MFLPVRIDTSQLSGVLFQKEELAQYNWEITKQSTWLFKICLSAANGQNIAKPL